MIPDVQGDIIVDALRLLRRVGDALGELSRQRPQVGRKDDVGRFLAGVEIGLLRVGREGKRVGIDRRLPVAVLGPKGAVLGQVGLPADGALRRVLGGDMAGRLGEAVQRDMALGRAGGRQGQPCPDVDGVSALGFRLFQRSGEGFVGHPDAGAEGDVGAGAPSRSIFSWRRWRSSFLLLGASGVSFRAARSAWVASSVSANRA